MSASSLCMTAAVSSSVCNNLYSAQCSQIQFSTHFRWKGKFLKPFKLETQKPNSLLSSLLYSIPNLRSFAGGIDKFETSGYDEKAGKDPEAENTLEKKGGEEEEKKGTESNDEEGRLYVGNLPYAMTSFEVEEVFREAGNVVNVQIVYDKVTDRGRGFAFVTMGSKEEAKEAIRMFDGSPIGGRTVKVNSPEVPRGGEREVMGPKIRNSYRSFIDSRHKIYAGNLGWGLRSQGLRNAFADQPGLVSARVIFDRDSGRSRGFGFVSFESAEDAQSALNAMNGVEVEGRPLRLSLAAERASASRSQIVERDTEENLDGSELVWSLNK